MGFISLLSDFFRYCFTDEEEDEGTRERRINNMPDEQFKEYRAWCMENNLDYYKCRIP